MISNCGHDERGKYTGGKAGDQTGHEWEVIGWYNRPWNVVLRHPDESIGKLIADLAYSAAMNDNIGYDQSQRYTFWEALKASGYRPERITDLCEADCSSGVAAIVKAVGFLRGDADMQGVSIYAYTGNLKSALKKAGFSTLTDDKYLTSDSYLLPGDVLLYEGHHTAINLSRGDKADSHDVVSYPHWVQSGDKWYYRIAPNVNKHGWEDINHHRYYFDSDGMMATGWRQILGSWYYFQPSGGLEGALYTSDANGRQTIKYID